MKAPGLALSNFKGKVLLLHLLRFHGCKMKASPLLMAQAELLVGAVGVKWRRGYARDVRPNFLASNFTEQRPQQTYDLRSLVGL